MAVASLFSRLLGLVTDVFAPKAEPPPQETVQRQLDALSAQFDANVTRLAEGFADGRVTLGQFNGAMASAVRQHHLAAAVVASGGIENANPQTLSLAQQVVSEQLGYLQNWMDELFQQFSEGKLPSVEYLANRARLYGKAAGQTASRASVQARGLPTLPQYPRDGQTRCLVNCKCTLRIEPLDVVNGNYNVFWQLHPGETCPDCKRMSRTWKPLKIRRGRIIQV